MINRDSEQDKGQSAGRSGPFSLLGLVDTKYPKIIKLVSGGTTLVIRSIVCPKILVLCVRVGRKRKKNKKGQINIEKKVSTFLVRLSGHFTL